MVRVKGPLDCVESHGWVGKYLYRRRGVVVSAYPIGLLGHIHVPYSWFDRGINGEYSVQAFGLNPYKRFIAQYYNVKGWCYQMRRTWHGMQATIMSPPISNAPSTPTELGGQILLKEAVEIWQAMSQITRNVYNNWREPAQASGFNRWIGWYLKVTPNMPIYWGTLQRSAVDNQTIENKMVDQDAPIVRYPFNFRQYQLFNMVLHQGAGFPDSPVEAQLFYNSSDDVVYVYKNGAWSALGAGGGLLKNWFSFRRINRYHVSPHLGVTASSGSAMNANYIYAVPFYTAVALTVKGIALNVSGVHASNVRLGIYEDDGTVYPGDLIVDAGEQSVNSLNGRVASCNQVLVADTLYWLVAHFQGTPSITKYAGANLLMSVLGASAPNNSNTGLGLMKSLAYDVLAGTFPAGASIVTDTVPLISLLLG